MGQNLWWLFFSMSAGIGFFGSLLLITGISKQRPGTRPLGFVLLNFSITLVHYVMVWSGKVQQFPHLSALWAATNYLYGPLLLLFFWGQKKPGWKLRAAHFIPAILLIMAWIPFGLLPAEQKLEWMQNTSPYKTSLLLHPKLLYLLSPIFMVGSQILYAIYFIWKSNQQKNGDRKLKRLVALLFSIFVIAQVAYFLLIKHPDFKIEWDYMISLAMTLCIFRIALLTFQHPEYFFLLKKRSPLEGKYTTSPLTNGQSSVIAERLKNYVTKEQVYLNPDLRLPALAEQVQLSSHQVSQAINESFQCSFSEWINRFRIEQACQLLTDEKASAKEAAYQSGFNSISSFYQVFKKEKGMTPTQFSKQHQENFL